MHNLTLICHFFSFWLIQMIIQSGKNRGIFYALNEGDTVKFKKNFILINFNEKSEQRLAETN